MNDAHLHLIVNHFPILGVIFGFGILIVGLILNNNIIKNVAYLLFVVAAIFALFSVQTGGGAAHVVKNIPDIGKEIKKAILTHAELAEKFAYLLYALAFISLVGLYLNIKNHSQAVLISYIIAAIAAASVFIAVEVGSLGGEIRHTEFKADATTGRVQNNVTEAQAETENVYKDYN